MENKAKDKNKVGIAQNAMGLVKKAKQAVVSVVDQNDDGSFDIKDVTVIAGNLGSSVQKAAVVVKDGATEKRVQLGDRWEKSRRIMDKKTLCPIFPEDLEGREFFLQKLVRIIEMDKKHAESEVCKGSIGHRSEHKGMNVINIYPDKVSEYGLTFYPDLDSEIYYVDPCDKDHYIALDDYFNYLKVVRVNELQRIAQDLGAKHFRVTYKEENTLFLSKQKNVKGKMVTPDHSADVAVDIGQKSAEKTFTTIEVAAEMECPGHAPVEPELKYFKKDPSIQTLITLRMGNNPIFHQRFTLKCINSSGIKVNDAKKIDAALTSMKCTESANVESEAKSEDRRVFEYEIDF